MAVSVADDADWDAARMGWNVVHDQRPLAVVFPETADDVAAVVDFAREQGVRITAQATGHFAATLAPLDDVILREDRAHAAASTDRPRAPAARAIGAGAQWQDVAAPAAEHGLAGLAGSAPDVGVVGYTLGGGLGWLGRKYGLAANSVVAAEIVTADGQIAHHRPRQRARPVLGDPRRRRQLRRSSPRSSSSCTRCASSTPATSSSRSSARPEVLHAWREWVATVPDELTSCGRILHLPPIPEVPEPCAASSFALVEAAFVGDRGRRAPRCCARSASSSR